MPGAGHVSPDDGLWHLTWDFTFLLFESFIRILHHASLGSRDVVFGGTANPGEASGWLIEGARAAYSTQLRGYFDWMRTGCVGK